jgi:hypothetical protein
VHVLSGLASAGAISVVCGSAVRLVRIVLDYRIRRMEMELRRQESELRRQESELRLELLRKQLGLPPASQPAQAATVRHAIRRRRRG